MIKFINFFIIFHIFNNEVATATRIVGGEIVDIKNFPYQISLELDGKFHICGGSILNFNKILTAAHCVREYKAQFLNIRAGTNYSESNSGISIKVSSYKIHPKYKEYSHDNDVAVITLAKNLHYSDAISPILLPENEPQGGETAIVSGWGSIYYGGTISHELRAVEVKIINREKCIKDYDLLEITKGMICAGWEGGGQDSCQGDSGGPLVLDGQLIGVVSWGLKCAIPKFHGVYANVAYYRSWIMKNL